jgi:hypothetical protein
VDLGPRGYEREVRLTVRSDDPHTFTTDWKGKDPTRLSARIRAAAAVLQRRGLEGRFHVSHFGGILTIQRA